MDSWERDTAALRALGLRTETVNALRRAGWTLERLRGASDDEIRGVRNIGKRSLAEIRRCLAESDGIERHWTRVPAPLWRRLVARAQEEGLTEDQIIADCLSRCLGD